MATYLELHDLHDNVDLKARVGVALMIAAEKVFGEATPSSTRLAWASEVLQSISGQLTAAYRYILAANNTATVAQIIGASDATIQTAVEAWRDKLYP